MGRHALEQVFQQQKIEDLWRPFFCVTANISTGEEGIHQRGNLVSSLYASNAPPGIFPPQLMEGQLHCDGGVLNNLPVDVMRTLYGKDCTVIASRLSSNVVANKPYRFPDKVTFLRYIKAKYGKDNEHVYPEFFDMFIKGLLIGSSAKEQHNCQDANVLIQPDLGAFSTYSATPEQEQEMMDKGYRDGLNAMKHWP